MIVLVTKAKCSAFYVRYCLVVEIEIWRPVWMAQASLWVWTYGGRCLGLGVFFSTVHIPNTACLLVMP